LAADLVVASRRAAFGIPEVKRCLIAGAGGLFRLARKIPENLAMECALTGDPISAARAAGCGLVNELVEDGQAVEAALALAARIATNSPLAVRESRRVILATNRLSDEESFAVSAAALAVVTRSVDFREGLAAFLEKRPPVWTGR
jgi:enoyl-CoA hydratase/carnithine racemase